MYAYTRNISTVCNDGTFSEHDYIYLQLTMMIKYQTHTFVTCYPITIMTSDYQTKEQQLAGTIKKSNNDYYISYNMFYILIS